MSTIEYSVIIPTCNRALYIGNAIESLVRQTIHPDKFEIIIVNDASTDSTAQKIESYQSQCKKHQIRCINLVKNGGPATARNVGIRNAEGSICFFTDDDCQLPAEWIEKHIEVYRLNPGIAAVGGWYAPPQKELRENRYQLFVYLWYMFLYRDAFGSLEGHEVRFKYRRFPAVNTANFSVKKYVARAVGGFDERFLTPGSEDVDFGQRIRENGFRMYYLPLIVMHHKSFNLLGLIGMARNRIKGRLIREHYGRLRNSDRTDPSFLFIWKRFIQHYSYTDAAGNRIRLPMSISIVSAIFLFLVFSRIARWYWRKKLGL